MTLRLGFCGVGRWARKLAESFRACGAEVVAYDRGPRKFPPCPDCTHDHAPDPDRQMRHCSDGMPWGFGQRKDWRDQLTDKSIDAIVAVAPPEVTTEVAMACAAAGKPVMATKPLFDHPERITAPFYVDFWRLWSVAHRDAKESGVFAGYFLYGTGPARSFPGVLDYGPHVMAAVLDFDPSATVDTVVNMGNRGGPPGAETFSVDFEASSGDRMRSWFGNGGPHSGRTIWGATETPTHIGTEPKEAIMQKFCRAFMADVSEGFVGTTLLDYSREGMRLLRRIREEAK